MLKARLRMSSKQSNTIAYVCIAVTFAGIILEKLGNHSTGAQLEVIGIVFAVANYIIYDSTN